MLKQLTNDLWRIAFALHTVNVHPEDKESLDTLVGCTAALIAMAAQIECASEPADQRTENTSEQEENDGR